MKTLSSRRISQIIAVVVPLLGWTAVLLRNWIASFCNSDRYPTCLFYEMTGYYCPGCGNTRAVLALLQGHILRAFGYNPMIPVLAMVLLACYGERVFAAFGKQVHLFPRSWAWFYFLLGAILAYDVLRNFFPSWTLLA